MQKMVERKVNATFAQFAQEDYIETIKNEVRDMVFHGYWRIDLLECRRTHVWFVNRPSRPFYVKLAKGHEDKLFLAELTLRLRIFDESTTEITDRVMLRDSDGCGMIGSRTNQPLTKGKCIYGNFVVTPQLMRNIKRRSSDQNARIYFTIEALAQLGVHITPYKSDLITVVEK